MPLGHDSADMLLMGQFTFDLSGLLLDSASVDLLLDSLLGRFKPLCFDQLCVSDLFVLFSLMFHDA